MSSSAVEATSAAAGAVISSAMLYPFDLAKVRLQSSTDKKDSYFGVLARIVKNEGLLALFSGVHSKCFESVLSTFSFFYWYVFLKSVIIRRFGALSPSRNLLVAALAGVLNITLTLPLDVVTTRLQTQKGKGKDKKNWSGMVKQILEEGGPLAFWRGYAVAVMLCCNPAINYTIFETLKAKAEKFVLSQRTAVAAATAVATASQTSALPVLHGGQIFVLGAVAKAAATVLTYPLIRAKIILTSSPAKQTQPTSGDEGNGDVEIVRSTARDEKRSERVLGMLSVLVRLWQTEGFGGWFKGCREQITLTVARNAFLLVNKEYIHAFALSLIALMSAKNKQ